MISRRRFASLLSHGIGASLALGATNRGRARRLLVFTKSAGYQHDVVRSTEGEPSVVDRAMSALAGRIGYTVTLTKDGARLAEELAAHDVVMFYTSGDLTVRGTDQSPPLPAPAKDTLLRAIENGLGFVGVHSASDTFHGGGSTIDPYIAMLGGEFEGHGRPQRARVTVIDRDFPGMPDARTLLRHGEWYAFHNVAPDPHALLVLETESVEGSEYRRASYPVVWARPFGQGRVFYTALGHFAEEWQDTVFLQIVEGGIRWAAGDVDADVSPNLGRNAPRR
jgi:hypothetical protein